MFAASREGNDTRNLISTIHCWNHILATEWLQTTFDGNNLWDGLTDMGTACDPFTDVLHSSQHVRGSVIISIFIIIC